MAERENSGNTYVEDDVERGREAGETERKRERQTDTQTGRQRGKHRNTERAEGVGDCGSNIREKKRGGRGASPHPAAAIHKSRCALAAREGGKRAETKTQGEKRERHKKK